MYKLLSTKNFSRTYVNNQELYHHNYTFIDYAGNFFLNLLSRGLGFLWSGIIF